MLVQLLFVLIGLHAAPAARITERRALESTRALESIQAPSQVVPRLPISVSNVENSQVGVQARSPRQQDQTRMKHAFTTCWVNAPQGPQARDLPPVRDFPAWEPHGWGRGGAPKVARFIKGPGKEKFDRSQIGEYVFVHKQLGKGGMGGTVQKAVRDNKAYAVKVMPKIDVHASQDRLSMFQEEVRIHSAASFSAYSITFVEILESDEDYFVVMEFAPGGTLFDAIVDGNVSRDRARNIFRHLMFALYSLNTQHIIHRDLKPENILFDANGDMKLADFGLAARFIKGYPANNKSCGSPNYAAPEILRGQSYIGPEVDVWSAGVILYAMLCGELPYDEDDVPALFSKIKRASWPKSKRCVGTAHDLLSKIFVVDTKQRATVKDILSSSWFHKA